MADKAALELGVPPELLEKLREKKLFAIQADTWAHAIATVQAPWNGRETPLDEALQWVRSTYGNERGWNIKLSDGSKLGNVRRYDPTKVAALTPPGPAADAPSLTVKWGGDGSSVTSGLNLVATKDLKDAEL